MTAGGSAAAASQGQGVSNTLAIVMHKAGASTERFIERHVRESFGGHAVAIARHAGTAPAFAQPLLVADIVRGGLLDRLRALPGRVAAYARHRYWGVPTGAERERILQFWRRHGVTAVLAEFGPLGCWIAPVARAAGLPVFVYFRGYDASSRLRSAGTVQAYKRLMRQVDGVFAVSAFLVDNLRRAGVSHENTHVIPSGTDTRVFSPGSKDPGLVVAVGRFVDKKRPEATVRAFAAAAARWPNLRMQMVGDGPQLERCRTLARELGVESRVDFLGAQDHAAIAALLSRARAFLQHSVTAPGGETEGLPSSIQEAMAAGAVVVSTRHAGIPGIVRDGETGWLVDEGDEEGYARALMKVFEDPARADTMARQARQFAERRLDTRMLQQAMEAVILAAAQVGGSQAQRKLLVLTYDADKPSFRYRIAPLLQELQRRGWQVSVDTLPLRSYGLRIWQRLGGLRSCDVVLLHKLRLHPLEAGWVARCNARTLFDIDDATWLSQPGRPGELPVASASRVRAFRGMCRFSRLTLAGNPFLAQAARAAGGRVQIVPTAVDVSAFAAPDFGKRDGGVAVWIGLPGNLQYLEPLRPAFSELSRRFPGFRLRIVSSSFPDWDDVAMERVTWRPGIETQALPTADIGLMPLSDDEFTRGKCAFKLLQYMAASLPCVASPVGVNSEVVTDGETGLLAATPAEWQQALERLLADRKLRERMGAAGRQRVERDYDLRTVVSHAADLVEALSRDATPT